MEEIIRVTKMVPQHVFLRGSWNRRSVFPCIKYTSPCHSETCCSSSCGTSCSSSSDSSSSSSSSESSDYVEKKNSKSATTKANLEQYKQETRHTNRDSDHNRYTEWEQRDQIQQGNDKRRRIEEVRENEVTILDLTSVSKMKE